MPRPAGAGLTRPQVLLLVVLAALVAVIAFNALTGRMRPDASPGDAPGDGDVWWVLHEDGRLAVGPADRPPDGTVPPGDRWVRAVVLRCRKDTEGHEFVAFHREASGGRVARPGGPWFDVDSPEGRDIVGGAACPRCGAFGSGAFDVVTPAEARRLGPGPQTDPSGKDTP